MPSKVASGLFIIGCSDCGCAYFKFNREGATALPKMPGWFGREQLKNERMTTCIVPRAAHGST
jgi:hypothetical protein